MTDAAAQRWRADLESWAIPDEILESAPRSPYGFSAAMFGKIADALAGVRTPTVELADEAPPDAGVVLDVGCGGGAASLPLAARASLIIGIDQSEDMLAELRERAEAAGVAVLTHLGRWPDVAGDVPPADVVVCRNVAYNVPDLDHFARVLTAHARHRVVMEMTQEHPMAWMTPFWEALHGIGRPARPTVEDAVAVLSEAGLQVGVRRWDTRWILSDESEAAVVDSILQRLCLDVGRAEEVRVLLRDHPVPQTRPAATLWWEGQSPRS
jgi:SAM-dependent methyltransferase